DLCAVLHAPCADQPIRIANRLVAVARIIADPPLIDLGVIARLDAIDYALIPFQPDIFSAGIDGRDRWRLLQQPDTLLEEKILIEQRADGADINDISRQFVIQRLAGENINLLLMSAAIDL